MKRNIPAVLAVMLIGLVALWPARGSAVEPDEFEILLRADGLLFRDTTGRGTLAESYRTLTVVAGREICTTVDLLASQRLGTDVVIRVGAPGQPAGCAAEGAELTLFADQRFRLHVAFLFRAGTQEVLSNFAPAPPGLFPDLTDTLAALRIQAPSVGDAGLLPNSRRD